MEQRTMCVEAKTTNLQLIDDTNKSFVEFLLTAR